MTRQRPEAVFQGKILDLARLTGWMVYHPPDNIPVTAKSGKRYVQNVKAGFPDLVLVRAPDLLFWELKAESGVLSSDQKRWIDALHKSGQEVRVLRPSDWPYIQARLTTRR